MSDITRTKYLLFALLSVSALSSCVHYDDVVSGNDGLNVVTIQPDIGDDSPDEEDLTEQANSQASDYCQDVYKGPYRVISTEKQPIDSTDGDDFKVVLKFRCL